MIAALQDAWDALVATVREWWALAREELEINAAWSVLLGLALGYVVLGAD